MSARDPQPVHGTGYWPVRLVDFPRPAARAAVDPTAEALERLCGLAEFPGEPVAATVAEIVTVATLDEIKALTRSRSIDRDRLTLGYFNCRAEELTETAARWTIEALTDADPFDEAVALRVRLYLSAGTDEAARLSCLDLVATNDLDEMWLDRAAAERLAVEVRRQDLHVEQLERRLAELAPRSEVTR